VTGSATGIQTGDRTEMSGWMQQGAVAVYLQRTCLRKVSVPEVAGRGGNPRWTHGGV